MAQVQKRRSLVNSGKRRRRSNPRKRMTAKQIKFFGTKAQRAALKRRRSPSTTKRRKRNYGTREGRSWSSYSTSRKAAARRAKSAMRGRGGAFGLSNPRRRRRRNKAASHRRKNVGQIFSIGLAGLAGNPGTKRKRRTSKNMARRRRRSNAGRRAYTHRRRTRRAVGHRRRRRSNPTSYRRRRRVMHHRRRRNPSGGGFGSSSTTMFKSALGIIGGAVATRYTTQFVLQGKNTGWMGYLGNAVAALVLGWAAKKFLKSPQLGTMVTLGGFTGLALRLLTDLTPVGQYINLQLSGAGKAGDIGIGMITDSVFTVPTVFNNGSMTQAQIPTQYTQAMSIAAAAKGSGGMGSYRRRRAA